MVCTLEKNIIEKTIEFHGHNCPGLSIGIRAAELAIDKLNIRNSQNPVCVTETDMCGVDAIQFLTGCSFGKGNLIHKDYGKSAFTFYDRDKDKGFRVVFRDNFTDKDTDTDTIGTLMEKVKKADSTKKDEKNLINKKTRRINQIMTADLNDLFVVEKMVLPPVRSAKILKSIQCDTCKEMTMESRIRLFDNKSLCIPCFKEVEQKI
jgi:formylmethanofuran dehydrogenase subunit E